MFPRRVHVLRFGLIVALIGAAFALFFVQLEAPVRQLSRSYGGPEGARMRALKREIDQLPKGKIYLDAPVEMKVGDKRTVDARVGVNVPDYILRGHARAGDQSTEGALRVSR